MNNMPKKYYCYSKKFAQTWLAILLILSCISTSQAKEKINIGLLLDGHSQFESQIVEVLQVEMNKVLGAKYDVSLPQNKLLASAWSVEQAAKNFNALEKDPQVNVIISLGVLTSNVIFKQQQYAKPVIALSIVPPAQDAQGTSAKSTKNNLNTVLFNHSIVRDLAEFHKLSPYQDVGLVFNGQLMSLLTRDGGQQALVDVANKTGANLRFLPTKDSIDDLVKTIKKAKASGMDAIYVGYLGPFEEQGKPQLITEINRMKLKSFAMSKDDVQEGILAAVAPDQPFNKLVRRLVLNVEAILEGRSAASLPSLLSFDEKLTINMETARTVDFSPKFDVLADAELLNEFDAQGLPQLTLSQVMRTAVAKNLDLQVERSNLESAHLDKKAADTNYLPQISLSSTGTQIDKKRAEGSFGQQAEKTVTNGIRLEQLIYSDEQLGSMEIQKRLIEAAENSYRQQELDVLLDAALAYFNVLRTDTVRNIQAENIKLIKQNLALAKQREAAGYAGLSDVYHWEIQLANSNTQYVAAGNDFRLSKLNLNQLLNTSLARDFTVQDIAIDEDGSNNSFMRSARQYVDSPRMLDLFTDFLIAESLRNSPEIRELDTSIDAQNRRLTSLKRKRFLPNFGLLAERNEVASRSGAGADVPGVDPEDSSWNVSLNLSLPLYQGGGIEVEKKQVATDIQQLKDQRLNLQTAIEFRVRRAILDLVTQAINLQQSQTAADFADKKLQLVQDAYRTGKASVIELSDAQNTAISASQQALNSNYEFITALLSVERAVGHFTVLMETADRLEFFSRLTQYFENVSAEG